MGKKIKVMKQDIFGDWHQIGVADSIKQADRMLTTHKKTFL